MKNWCTFGVLIWFIVLTSGCIKIQGDQDHEDVFIQRMRQVFQKPNDVKQVEAKVNTLTQFSFKYPNSRFADDAQYLPILMGFTGSAVAKDKKGAEMFIGYMEQFVEKFGNQRLEERTCLELQRLSQKMSFIYLPYDKIFIYMKGFLGYELGNYQGSVNYFLKLKDSVDFSKEDPTGDFVSDIYVTLAICYVRLEDKDGLTGLYKESLERFPEKNKMLEMIKKLIDDFQMFQK